MPSMGFLVVIALSFERKIGLTHGLPKNIQMNTFLPQLNPRLK